MEKSISTEDHARLASLLRQLRQEAGLHQEELADRLGVNQSFVSKYELGERRLDLVQLKQICEALGITLAILIKRWDR